MFKVFTLNLNGTSDACGSWALRKELILKAFERVHPDVVALQAVRRAAGRCKGRDQATQLLAEAGRTGVVHYEPGSLIAEGETEGSALVSFAPELQYSSSLLSLSAECEDKTKRLVIRGDYAIGDLDVVVYNCHFSWVDSENENNAREALAFIGDPKGQRGIIVGDFNATSENPGPKLFFEQGWTDAWSFCHRAEPGYTFDARRPTMRIDYAMVSPSLKGLIESIKIIGAGSLDGQTVLSDHLGLLLTLDLQTNAKP